MTKKRYADAPNSPHKKWIFGRINRFYVEPARASEIVEEHLDPLLYEYTEYSELASKAAVEGELGEFSKYYKQALNSYNSYIYLEDLLTNPDYSNSMTEDEWKNTYKNAIINMGLTEQDKAKRKTTQRPRIELENFDFERYPQDIKDLILNDIKSLSKELYDSTAYQEGETDSLRKTDKYNVIIEDAKRKNYTGTYNFLEKRALKRKQEAYEHNEQYKAEQQKENDRKRQQAQETNEKQCIEAQRAYERQQEHVRKNLEDWAEYDKENSQYYNDVDPLGNVRPQNEQPPKYERVESPYKHTQRAPYSSPDDYQIGNPYAHQTTGYDIGNPYGEQHDVQNENPADQWDRPRTAKVYTRVNGRLVEKNADGRDVILAEAQLRGNSKRDDNDTKRSSRHVKVGDDKFGKMIYNNWNRLPVVSNYLSPYSNGRRRVGPFMISTGLHGMRHPLDIISNVSLQVAGVSYSIYSRDYKPGITHFNAPGFVDLRGKRKKKEVVPIAKKKRIFFG